MSALGRVALLRRSLLKVKAHFADITIGYVGANLAVVFETKIEMQCRQCEDTNSPWVTPLIQNGITKV